jgi:aryl-alcohol dehydrogenase-like predicted oxidoreductase
VLVHKSIHTHVPRFKRTGKRNDIFIATKFGAGSSSGKIVDGSPAYVKEACQKSLEKLGVDQIDLYYAHRYGIHDQSMPMSWTSDAVSKKG